MSRNLTADLAADLRMRIVDGVIQPGDEASQRKHPDRRIRRQPDRGPFRADPAAGRRTRRNRTGAGQLCADPAPGRTRSRAPGSRPVASLEDRLQLLEFRIGVESEAAALAARNRYGTAAAGRPDGPGGVHRQRRPPCARHEIGLRVPPGHRAASGNPFYSDCLASLGQTMIAMPRTRLITGGEHYARDHFEQVVQEHGSIYAAIAEGDGPSSSAAMRTHLANSRRRLAHARSRPPRRKLRSLPNAVRGHRCQRRGDRHEEIL